MAIKQQAVKTELVGDMVVKTTKQEVSYQITLSEEEMRALHALQVYGVEDFLRLFYARLGESALRPHEAGLRRLFERLRQTTID